MDESKTTTGSAGKQIEFVSFVKVNHRLPIIGMEMLKNGFSSIEGEGFFFRAPDHAAKTGGKIKKAKTAVFLNAKSDRRSGQVVNGVNERILGHNLISGPPLSSCTYQLASF
jgi:hypothetical protein